jgi:hypothetical protein
LRDAPRGARATWPALPAPVFAEHGLSLRDQRQDRLGRLGLGNGDERDPARRAPGDRSAWAMRARMSSSGVAGWLMARCYSARMAKRYPVPGSSSSAMRATMPRWNARWAACRAEAGWCSGITTLHRPRAGCDSGRCGGFAAARPLHSPLGRGDGGAGMARGRAYAAPARLGRRTSGLRLATAHDLAELRDAARAGADAVLLSRFRDAQPPRRARAGTGPVPLARGAVGRAGDRAWRAEPAAGGVCAATAGPPSTAFRDRGTRWIPLDS